MDSAKLSNTCSYLDVCTTSIVGLIERQRCELFKHWTLKRCIELEILESNVLNTSSRVTYLYRNGDCKYNLNKSGAGSRRGDSEREVKDDELKPVHEAVFRIRVYRLVGSGYRARKILPKD